MLNLIKESLILIRESLILIKESFSLIKECWNLINESFSLIKESFNLINESFSLIKESFNLINESFSLIKESFSLIKECWNLINEIFSLVKYTKRPNPRQCVAGNFCKDAINRVSTREGLIVSLGLYLIVKTNLNLSAHRDCWKILTWHISLRHLWYNEVDEVANLHDDGLILRRIRLIATVEHEHQL